MQFKTLAILAFASYTSAQAVVGKAYGFAAGVTGGGNAAAVTPKDGAELAKLLSDDVARTIVLDKEFDFTGTKTTGKGCQRKQCSVAQGGQYFLGDLSCGGNDVNPVAAIEYDAAADTPLVIGSNKSLLGVGGKGAIKGKGLQLKANAKNIIIQGITISQINPGVVWGGDALDLKGGNTVWVDHCKFSLIGRMFVVAHFADSKITLSNNEFDGVTTTSSTCNGDHYWTMMFISGGDQLTLDKNYFHDVSGRAPKLDGANLLCHATNNYFSNMDGHAFEANTGTTALLEGNVFKNVKETINAAGTTNAYTVANGGAACNSALGRACVANVADASGKLVGGEGAGALTAMGRVKANLVAPIAASGVAASVLANAGPSKLGAAPAANAAAPAGNGAAAAASSRPSVAPAVSRVVVAASSPAASRVVVAASSPAVAASAAPTRVAAASSAAPIAASPAPPAATSLVPELECDDDATPAPPANTVPEIECDDDATATPPPASTTPELECDDEAAAADEETATPPPAAAAAAKIYERCGGEGFTGPTTCESGCSCKVQNPWYSQCVPTSARARREIRERNERVGLWKSPSRSGPSFGVERDVTLMT